ncbi:Protein DSF2 [Ceratocystis platani]|uniref:Protein DSF2 n=2 Tax=Ceratocystis TaxID=5157 RepID=A0A0F8CZA9_CERFI|nr:Protein DSF2 [Ceratocystis platani]
MSAEEHLDKGIECHENGSLNESTYHLRIAAKQNNPTAMLLYALACRHGWGMRPNQKEGVEWLRRAAELAQEEIAEDEEHAKEGKKVNTLENKTRKAQFALSIYELGVSHMNGWGIEQDKKLALKCFEIAGTWGDVDALAEAGFCYAQGMGCKKDLKKSAKFYRMAEAKGMNMVGNSWIHKAKYDSDDESKKKKGKSRSHRHLFSHKSSS